MTEYPAYSATYRTSWAVVVGINGYHNLPPLTYAAKDAHDVAIMLVTKFGFPSDQVFILQDENATRDNILSVFEGVLNQPYVQPDDRIIIYFAGHGLTRTTSDGAPVGYIAPVEAEPRAWRSMIRMNDLMGQATFLNAKHILFLVDACYSGLSLRRAAPSDSATERFLMRRAVQVMTAGRADEQVVDGGDRQGDNSAFTGYLLEALAGKAATASGLMTASDVMRYVYRSVMENPDVRQTPQYGWLDGDGDFIFQFPQKDPLPLSVELNLRQGSVASRLMTVENLTRIASAGRPNQSALAVQRLHEIAVYDPDPRVSEIAGHVLDVEMLPALPVVRVDVTPNNRPTVPARPDSQTRLHVPQQQRSVVPLRAAWLIITMLLAVIAIGSTVGLAAMLLAVRATKASAPPTGAAAIMPTTALITEVPVTEGTEVTATLSPTATVERQVLFSDDFSAAAMLWQPLPNDGRVTQVVQNGQMEVGVYSPYGLWITQALNFNADDADLSVNVTLRTTQSDSAYGVVFRQVDYDNYYYYKIMPDGTFALILQRSGSVTYLLGPQSLPNPPSTGNAHDLGIAMHGSSIVLSFDGTQIGQVNNSAFHSGRVGLAVQTNELTPIEVSFDNFRVYAP